MLLLSLQNINKTFGSNHVVKNLNLDVREGEFLTILGPSGCGKTSTLRMVGGFETPDSGNIILREKVITRLPPYKRNINTVFQHYALFPNMTVAENIAFGLKQKRTPAPLLKNKVNEMLEMVRLSGFEKRKPQELSGGQQQRVAIARAIANNPDILLLDEPLGALDLKLRKQMQFELKSLHKKLNKTFVYVTHDQEEALTMSDRIAVMNNGVLEQISNGHDIYHRPKTKFVADFIGEANVIRGIKIAENKMLVDDNHIPIAPCPLPDNQPVSLFIRPENFSLNLKQGKLKGIIEEVVFTGSHSKIMVQCGNLKIATVQTNMNAAACEPNAEVYLDWDPDKASVFED